MDLDAEEEDDLSDEAEDNEEEGLEDDEEELEKSEQGSKYEDARSQCDGEELLDDEEP